MDYDAELSLLNDVLRRACGIERHDHVLDVGCGSGQTTREAARMAAEGGAQGVDVSAEAIARGQRITQELARDIGERYAEAIDPVSDLRGSAWYRKQMIRVWVRRAIMSALDGTSENGRR